jgi:hypothetical protein
LTSPTVKRNGHVLKKILCAFSFFAREFAVCCGPACHDSQTLLATCPKAALIGRFQELSLEQPIRVSSKII